VPWREHECFRMARMTTYLKAERWRALGNIGRGDVGLGREGGGMDVGVERALFTRCC